MQTMTRDAVSGIIVKVFTFFKKFQIPSILPSKILLLPLMT